MPRVNCHSCSRRRIKYADGLCEVCHQIVLRDERRVAIVFDGVLWHVRRIESITHDLETDAKIYRCDRPISNDHATPEAALRSAKLYQEILMPPRESQTSKWIGKTVPKWIKSWCCQYPALRVGAELRCTCCGNMLFDNYATQRLIVEGEPYDESETVPNPFHKEAWARTPKKKKAK